jgi:transposase InsO family protein
MAPAISRRTLQACRDLGLKHIRTKPYTPRTNGKAERFIQTALREWAYESLPDVRSPRRRATSLAPPIQLAQAARQPKVKTTNQSPRFVQGQPVEALQLVPPMMRCPADEGLITLDTTMQQQLGPVMFVTNGGVSMSD